MKFKLFFVMILIFGMMAFSSMTVAQECQGCHVVESSIEQPASAIFIQDAMPMEESQPGWLNWMMIVMAFFVAGANAITASLPSTVQGSAWYNMGMKLLNFLAMNFGKNKNSDDKPIDEANRPPKPLD